MALLAASSPPLRCNFHDWKCDSEPSGSGVGGWCGVEKAARNSRAMSQSHLSATICWYVYACRVCILLYVTVSTLGPCLWDRWRCTYCSRSAGTCKKEAACNLCGPISPAELETHFHGITLSWSGAPWLPSGVPFPVLKLDRPSGSGARR